MARSAIIVTGMLLAGVTSSWASLPVTITSHSRSISAEGEVISDFGCNDFLSNSVSAPDIDPWKDTVTVTAQCGFEPEAVANAMAMQVSEIAPERFAAMAAISHDGWGSEYSDPRSYEFFCSGAGGGGSSSYYITFEVLETVAYHVTGVADNSGTGCTNIELNTTNDNVFFFSFYEEFDEDGLLEPGEYFLSAMAYVYEPAQICNGDVSGGGFLDFTLDLSDPCPADVDNSGAVDVDDLVDVITNWGTCDGCPADVDGNGVVDVDDLVLTITGWGVCP